MLLRTIEALQMLYPLLLTIANVGTQDVISTDLHVECCEGPAYDLPAVMSKLLHVGMPLPDVVQVFCVGSGYLQSRDIAIAPKYMCEGLWLRCS